VAAPSSGPRPGPARPTVSKGVGGTLAANVLGCLVAIVAAPFAALALLVRPDWRSGLGERLGGVPEGAARGGVWVHAASVGEGLAARRLISGLRERGWPVYASLTTVTGRDVLRQSISDPTCGLAPLDHPLCVARAMRVLEPSALVLIETELWPALIAGAARRGAPVVLVSGRLSDRSYRRYRSLRWALGSTLRRLHYVGARSTEDAERFVALGVPSERVGVTGDLKLDPPGQSAALDEGLRVMLGGVAVAVAGSTHPGEEAAALEALARCEAQGRSVALVIAPRRPARFDEVWSWLGSTGRVARRRSEGADAEPLAAGEVLLLDTLGELAGAYSLASATFVGGTLAPIGGHNLLEPVQAGCAVAFGPHVQNVREVAGALEASGAGARVSDGEGLGAVWSQWLGESGPRDRAQAGLRALGPHRGSVERSIEVVQRALGEASSPAT
jgi:3-deoxy-D-manno-octulosonic-acid transferase